MSGGTKYYSTGSLYSDHVSVMAVTPDGRTVAAVVPVTRDGVRLDDDWDGMGQRLTASGTSHFDDVAVHDDELLASPRGDGGPTTRFAFLQLYLVAVMAGIAAMSSATRQSSRDDASAPSATDRARCRPRTP